MNISLRATFPQTPWYIMYNKDIHYKKGVVSYGKYNPEVFEGTYFQTLPYVDIEGATYYPQIDLEKEIVTHLYVPSYTTLVEVSTDEYSYSWTCESLAQMRYLPYRSEFDLPKVSLPATHNMSLGIPDIITWHTQAASKKEVIESFACPHRIPLPPDPTDIFLNIKISIQFSESLLTEASYVLLQHNAVRRCTTLY